MRKVQLLPNFITAFGLSCGLFAIFKISMVSPVVDASTLIATAGILLLAALADVLDGAIARIVKGESDFGGVFDSLADAISFGVAPAAIVLKSAAIKETEQSFFLIAAAMIYSLCGVLRLARFNVMHVLPPREALQKISFDKTHFTGLPIPAAAAALVSSNLFLHTDFNAFFSLSNETKGWILFGQLIVLGYFMISRWKFPSLKSLHIRIASFRLAFITSLSAIFIFYGIFHRFALVFFIISWSYVLIAWLLSLARLIVGKKAKALEDFEPESEETD